MMDPDSNRARCDNLTNISINGANVETNKLYHLNSFDLEVCQLLSICASINDE